ncbi:hypothetical protein H0H93_010216 [Arthromyces matolae]|nr:hypothetical protein H0H93_010216 [Arthromyces matolae]
MRPRSMVGGDLHWIWKPYELYEKVDYVYGVKAYENGEGFAGAAGITNTLIRHSFTLLNAYLKAVLNVLEISMNLIYLFLVYIKVSDVAPLFGYTGAVMTLAKTILYTSQEYFCSGCSTGHNDPSVAFFFWIMPNL